MQNTEPIAEAVILMAGVGSRLGAGNVAVAKPLVRIGGQPLICYLFDALECAGVRTVHAVMGSESYRFAAELRPLLPENISLNEIVNPNWQKQNGVSALCAAEAVSGPFLLTMADHLFEFAILKTLLAEADRTQVNLAVDKKIESIFDLEDATKVQTREGRVIAIGKDLQAYDAIDTGAFLCSQELFHYLRGAQRNGDCSLSDGIRLMAADAKVRAIDIHDAWWQDVDTPEMLRRAEEESARLLRDGGSRLAQKSFARQS
ncbi:MAG: NTP transferase domain-containing protein [Chthoniobacterales bacterium]